MSASILGTISFIVIGVGFVYLASRQVSKRKRLQLSGLQVDGVIIRLETDKSLDSRIMYPVIEFTTLERQTIIAQHNFGAQPAAYKVRQQVNVLYNLAEPTEFVLNPDGTAWEVYIFGVLGIGFMLFGLHLGGKL